MAWLSILFAITALLYASVGFGGGSTYNALLYLGGVDYELLPIIALICNIIVVTGGTIRYARAGEIDWRRIWPIFTLSVPMAWFGGQLIISQTVFIGVLGVALLVSGLLMLLQREGKTDAASAAPHDLPVTEAIAGGGIGFVAGLVGIGGGIFLAPLLHLMKWGSAKAIAGTASVFILVNSMSGLVGQMLKLGASGRFDSLSAYWLLFPAVFIGGQIGSHIGLKLLSPQIVRRMTAILVLYVAARLLLGLAGVVKV